MGYIIWFTGMSGSGKTTLSNLLFEVLIKNSFSVLQVDGDQVRKTDKNYIINEENIIKNNLRIIEEIDKKKHQYQFILVSVISPFKKIRQFAKNKWGDIYIEIFVNCKLKILIKRDTKNLYKKYYNGEINNLIGMSEIPYQEPSNPNLIINSDLQRPNYSIDVIVGFINNILKRENCFGNKRLIEKL